MRIHIAGFPVRVGTVQRQRCAWCGEMLIDDDLSNILTPNEEDGSPGAPPSMWEPNALVAVDGCARYTVHPEDGNKLPSGCCANAVELRRVK